MMPDLPYAKMIKFWFRRFLIFIGLSLLLPYANSLKISLGKRFENAWENGLNFPGKIQTDFPDKSDYSGKYYLMLLKKLWEYNKVSVSKSKHLYSS